MITQELHKKWSSIPDKVMNLFGNRAHQGNTPLRLGGSNLHDTWSKVHYSYWIEGVKEKFKEGDRVCLKQTPDITGTVPFFYNLTMIQEIHYCAEVDKFRNIPKAFAITIPGTTIPKWVVPDDYRVLSTQENNLADLRVKEKQVRSSEDDRPEADHRPTHNID